MLIMQQLKLRLELRVWWDKVVRFLENQELMRILPALPLFSYIYRSDIFQLVLKISRRENNIINWIIYSLEFPKALNKLDLFAFILYKNFWMFFHSTCAYTYAINSLSFHISQHDNGVMWRKSYIHHILSSVNSTCLLPKCGDVHGKSI